MVVGCLLLIGGCSLFVVGFLYVCCLVLVVR